MAVQAFKREWRKLKNFTLAVRVVQDGKIYDEWLRDEEDSELLDVWGKPIPKTIQEARSFVEDALSEAMSDLKIRVAWQAQEQKWLWTWESLDLVTIMYFMIGLDLQSSGWIRMCDGCKRFFLADRKAHLSAKTEPRPSGTITT